MKLCECGCGKSTKLATRFCPRRGYVKGYPYRFYKGHKPSKPFDAKIQIDKDGCHAWTGNIGRGGYGQHRNGKKMMLAHRFAYERVYGAIPFNLTVDHLCRKRHCVNPAHMELVPIRTNILRGVGPSARNAKVTHCPKGHLYDLQNTYICKANKRSCRKCHVERERERRIEIVSRHHP